MANERALWKALQRGMKGTWVPQRFEDKLSLGIPDVGFVLLGGGPYGFIELKRVQEYPKRETTPVRIPHKQHWKIQQAWIRRVGRLTGRVFLLLQVERDYYLFDWYAAQVVGDVTKAGLLDLAIGHWKHRMNYEELYQLLLETYWHTAQE